MFQRKEKRSEKKRGEAEVRIKNTENVSRRLCLEQAREVLPNVGVRLDGRTEDPKVWWAMLNSKVVKVQRGPDKVKT